MHDTATLTLYIRICGAGLEAQKRARDPAFEFGLRPVAYARSHLKVHCYLKGYVSEAHLLMSPPMPPIVMTWLVLLWEILRKGFLGCTPMQPVRYACKYASMYTVQADAKSVVRLAKIANQRMKKLGRIVQGYIVRVSRVSFMWGLGLRAEKL